MDPYTLSPASVNGPAEETLLGILSRIQDVQNQPLVPQNPLAQLGSALSGFASGVQGQANPALAQYRQQRQDQLVGLREQAGIAHSLAQLQTQRETNTLNKQTRLAEVARHMIQTGKDTGNVDQIAYGLVQLGGLGYGGPTTMQDARGLAQDVVNRDLVEKRGKTLAVYALLGSPLPGTPPEILSRAEKNPEALRAAFDIKDPAEEAAKLKREQEQGAQLAFKNANESRELTLRKKPGLLPSERLELDALTSLRTSPAKDIANELTRYFMDQDQNLPFDMAANRALRLIAEASDKLTDVGRIARDIRSKNAGLSEGESYLRAFQQTAILRQNTQQQEDQASYALDLVKDLRGVVQKIHSEGILGRTLSAGPNAIASLLGTNPDIDKLNRVSGYLRQVIRFLGDRGNLSDQDVKDALNLVPGVFTDRKVALDRLNQLETYVKRGFARVQQRKQSALSTGPETDPTDPYGIR